MRATGAVSACAIATVVAAISALAVAQTSNKAPEAQRTGIPPIDVPPINGASEEQSSHPVLRITSVEVMRSQHAPVMDIIRVRGLTSSTGWEEGELVPLTRGVPADGMLQLVFVARAPAEATEASGFEPIEAIFPLETDHPFKGVNVHSASNSVTVGSLPGYAEGKGAAEDCGRCVGKTFVARGAPAPSGRSASELVREESLPAQTRVIRPSDGIPTADSNPNRLTLILNKDGQIANAVWE
jgi:hypothetical protein